MLLSFFGQVMFPHHSDQMSQRSHVSRVTLQCSKIKRSPTDSVSDKVTYWAVRLSSGQQKNRGESTSAITILRASWKRHSSLYCGWRAWKNGFFSNLVLSSRATLLCSLCEIVKDKLYWLVEKNQIEVNGSWCLDILPVKQCLQRGESGLLNHPVFPCSYVICLLRSNLWQIT